MRFFFSFFGAPTRHSRSWPLRFAARYSLGPTLRCGLASFLRHCVTSLCQFASLLFTGTLEFIRVPHKATPKQLKVSKLALGLLLMLGCWSCAPEAPSSTSTTSLLGPDLLPGSTYTINPSQDTLLQGPAGAQLFIPAGAFGATTQHVTLEVKAALTLEDMVLGSLTTVTTDGNLLESSGMIYVQASQEGKQLSLHKDIQITLPTAVRPGSKVFNGIQDNDKIGWEESHKKNNSDLDQQILAGEQLYLNNCASCHSIDLTRDLTGPALGWVLFHKDKDWIKRFIYNANEVIASRDPYANQLYIIWNKAQMNAFTSFDSTDLENIVTFLYNSAKLQQFDTTGLREKLRNDSLQFEQIKLDRANREKLKAISNIFYIKGLGWYNIDRLLKIEDPNTIPLQVSTDPNQFDFLHLKVILPDFNTTFSAKKIDNIFTTQGVPLPKEGKVWLMLTGINQKEWYFALKEVNLAQLQAKYKLQAQQNNKEDIVNIIKSTF